MAENKGVVIPFPQSKGQQGRAFKGHLALAEEKGGDVTRETCIAILNTYAPMKKEMEELLAIPQMLFSVGKEGEASFSSREADTGTARAAAALLHGFPFPSTLPDYGIHISTKGSSVFCTLVDRSRKIVVTAEIRNLQSEEGSWAQFGLAVKDAVSTAESQSASNAKFDFVINKEGIIRSVKL